MAPIDVVHRSTTRRKSCAGCVKAKRRCDLTVPTCSRCRTRNLKCIYIQTSTAIAVASPEAFLEDNINATRIDPSSCETISPYESFQFPELALIEPHQIEYCISEFQRCISSLVFEGRAPFIHADLYHDTMPEIYQDLLSICSLYTHKTPSNAMICFRMLFLKLKKLIAASKSFTRVEDWLLAVQTLIMYQIIRIFDGDAQQKAFADRDFALLENWTVQLQQHCEGSWLLMESIRRTLLVSVIFRCLCKIMKDGMSDLVPSMASLPVSDNTAKWEGRETEAGLLVSYQGFVGDWNLGMVTTVDTYEMLLLKACRHAITI